MPQYASVHSTRAQLQILDILMMDIVLSPMRELSNNSWGRRHRRPHNIHTQ